MHVSVGLISRSAASAAVALATRRESFRLDQRLRPITSGASGPDPHRLEELHDLPAPSRQSSSSYLTLYPSLHLASLSTMQRARCPRQRKLLPSAVTRTPAGPEGALSCPCADLRILQTVVAQAALRYRSSLPGHIACARRGDRPASHGSRAAPPRNHARLDAQGSSARHSKGTRCHRPPHHRGLRPPGAGRERRGVDPQASRSGPGPGRPHTAPRGRKLPNAGTPDSPQHPEATAPAPCVHLLRARRVKWLTYPPATGRHHRAQELVRGMSRASARARRARRSRASRARRSAWTTGLVGRVDDGDAQPGEHPSGTQRGRRARGVAPLARGGCARPRRGRRAHARGRRGRPGVRGHVVGVDHCHPEARG